MSFSGLEALGQAGFARLPVLCTLQGGFELGSRETILEEEGRERAMVRGGVEWDSCYSLFLSPFSRG